jgi:hypothetical protein
LIGGPAEDGQAQRLDLFGQPVPQAEGSRFWSRARPVERRG